jgi:SAM-dependent methyltransferase
MLCSAATDIYTQCGFERLINIDALSDFTLHHLPNKYIGIMGLPENEMQWQINALRKIHDGDLSPYEMLNPETKLPGGYGSKFLREEPDQQINQMLEGEGKNILVWGAGDGFFELSLKNSGYRVSVLPINSVLGECCRKRGLKVYDSDMSDSQAVSKSFDVVLLRDVLHLIESPEIALTNIRQWLRPGGQILIRIPNLNYLRMIKFRAKNLKHWGLWNRDRIGAEQFTQRSLRKLVEKNGYKNIEIKVDIPQRFKKLNAATLSKLNDLFSWAIYLKAKKA